MLLEVLSVNVGNIQPIACKSGHTGIFKVPQTSIVNVTAAGLAGDVIVDTQNHGGVDQAVYVYCRGDYDWWHSHENLTIAHGHFGENLTIDGMTTADAHIGARLVGQNMTLEITSPRTPCETLAVRMKDSSFPKRFWKSGRTGFYCRVIRDGSVSAGEVIQLHSFKGTRVSIAEWIAGGPLHAFDEARRDRFLSVPLHYKAREQLLG